ncbi:jg10064 [Pararge aegeria aegeria]|uniref:Protein NATD1 n=1 Tax=Pararge aegeria aegeria TaxID=348720 RepID=A0A8S4SC76_9NEOP|nr:jg10064 [Pararge aegeria aegeria]
MFPTAEATIDYNKQDKIITFLHTNVPKEFQGKGVGKLLAEHAFTYASDNSLDVICKCHFLAKFYQDNLNKFKNLEVKLDLD